jgi:hypothetical protein
MTNLDADLIQKYRAVLRLVERGATEGERNAARRAAEKLEGRFPGLKEAAAQADKAEASAGSAPDMGDPFAGFPAGFGMPGINIESWIRDTLNGLFATLGRESEYARLAEPLKVEIATSARGRLEIMATLTPTAFDAAVEALREDESGIDKWAEQVGKRIAKELADDMRAAFEDDDEDEDDDYEDDDED